MKQGKRRKLSMSTVNDRQIDQAERCSQRSAFVCGTFQPAGFLRIPHSGWRRFFGAGQPINAPKPLTSKSKAFEVGSAA